MQQSQITGLKILVKILVKIFTEFKLYRSLNENFIELKNGDCIATVSLRTISRSAFQRGLEQFTRRKRKLKYLRCIGDR